MHQCCERPGQGELPAVQGHTHLCVGAHPVEPGHLFGGGDPSCDGDPRRQRSLDHRRGSIDVGPGQLTLPLDKSDQEPATEAPQLLDPLQDSSPCSLSPAMAQHLAITRVECDDHPFGG